jgi:hypothetical protein
MPGRGIQDEGERRKDIEVSARNFLTIIAHSTGHPLCVEPENRNVQNQIQRLAGTIPDKNRA